MPSKSRLCPFCRGLNSPGERRCYRCGRALPGPVLSGVIGFFSDSFGGEGAMTRALLGLCLVVFGLCFATDHSLPFWGRDQFKLSTTLRFGAMVGPLAQAQPFRYLSAVFVHFNVAHLAMNCWVLASVGFSLERALGKARFVMLFVATGMLGFVVSDLWYGFMGPPTAGASGAIFGLFGAAIGEAYARRDPNWKQILFQNIVWLVVLALLRSVNNAAHAGGLAVGAVLGFLFAKESRKLKLDLPFGVIAGLLLLTCVASVALSVFSPIWRSVRAQENSLQQ